MSKQMQNFVVLFRESFMDETKDPLAFQCWGDDIEHAEEQCMNAYPDCEIIWTWQGSHGVGIQPALNEWYSFWENSLRQF